jgi:3-dehydroquinate dehydratase/shikimate dehydrogenase
MNKGKICVSICAETADEFIGNISRAEKSADIVELRFDYLLKNELETALEKACNLKSEKTLLLTFRPKEQGGKQQLSRAERERFWCSGYDFCANWADVELDLVETASQWLFEKIICSYHDFETVPENLFEIYEKLKATNADVIKIAVHADEITDTITVWQILLRAKSENKQIIPIAMGEAGKWTRILGLAHGAFMTYTALDSGKETAPGQISVQDLIEVYRVKELDENTEIYGILGSNTTVSMSPYIHNAAFKFHNLNSVFVPLQVNNLDEFVRRMVKPETREIDLNFRGFAVTIPHKTEIIKHLDSIDETAKAVGAVNTVKIVDGKLHGYNTDADGFIAPLLDIYGDLKHAKVAVIGAGGAARACVYALKQNGAEVTIYARDSAKAQSLAEEFEVDFLQLSTLNSQLSTFRDFDILVNATPLGMKGKAEGETPVTAEQMKGLNLVYDLIYTPFQTKLMEEADRAGVPKIGGLAMLIAQAMKQQKIWTEKDAPMKEMSRAALKRLQ